jgi:hypothetical protein
MDYQRFADRPLTLCRRAADLPKRRRKIMRCAHGALDASCECCGAALLVAPSSMRQKKERGVPLVSDACGAEIAKLCRGGFVFALAPGAAEEFHRAALTPDDERLN